MKMLMQLAFVFLLTLGVFAADASAPAVLQFRLVAEATSSDSEQMVVRDSRRETAQKETLNVLKKVLLSEKDVQSVMAMKGMQKGQTEIALKLTKDGKKKFAEVTRDNIGKRLAIIIDGELYSAPKIMSEIPGGSAMISGNFSQAEAKELVSRIEKALKK